MNMRLNMTQGKSGFALVTAISITMMIAMLASAIYSVASYQVRAARKTREFLKARVIAEAGANARYNEIKHCFAEADFDTNPEIAFGGGKYQTTLESAGTNRALLTSVGKCGISSATITLSLRNFPKVANASTNTTESAPWEDVAMFTPGTIRINGSPSASVSGDVLCGDLDEKKGWPYEGECTEGASGNINEWFDVTKYTPFAYRWTGTAAALSQAIKDNPAQFDGQIVFFDGVDEVSIESCTLNCCLITAGPISVTGGAVCNGVNGLPTLVSVTGSIALHGGPEITGAIVAVGGSIASTGGGSAALNFTGPLVAQDGITFGGSDALEYDADRAEFKPPDSEIVTDNTVIIAWQ
ncbi:MAG: hypothetical protein PHR35_00015 [Kiritimatiellae bacterium]|nr:hypothetical protein [Kiritimatiellia bacterium]